MNGKLLLALCRTCAVTKQQESCTHMDSERSFIGTCVTDKVKRAVEKGSYLHSTSIHFLKSNRKPAVGLTGLEQKLINRNTFSYIMRKKVFYLTITT